MKEGIIVLGQFFQAESQQSVRNSCLAAIHVLYHFVLRPSHESFMPHMAIITAWTHLLEIVVKLNKTFIFSGKIGFGLSLEYLKLCLIESP